MEWSSMADLTSIIEKDVPTAPGVYPLHEGSDVLCVGESENL
jgi:hypothetical protein